MRRIAPLLLGPLAALACGDDRLQQVEDAGPPPPRCGDGVRNGDEVCEGGDLGDRRCQDLGFVSGDLTCALDCTFDTSRCARLCGNGRRDLTEECEGGDLNGQVCDGWGALACGADCRIERAGCALEPYREVQRLAAQAPAFAAFATRRQGGATVAEMFVAVPERHRIEIARVGTDGLFVLDGARSIALDPDHLALRPAVQDFNADGTSDVAVGYPDLPRLNLKLSSSTGLSSAALELGCHPREILAVDLDGDGDLDLVVPCASPLDGQAIPAKNDAGAFTPLAAVALGEATGAWRVFDANADGRPDLMVQLPGSQAVAVLAGDGALAFARGADLAPGEVPGEFVPLDVDSDGIVDLAVVLGGGVEVSILMGDGAGGFLAQPVAQGLAEARALTVLDVDLDGHPDLAFLTSSEVVVMRNDEGALGPRRFAAALDTLGPLMLGAADADFDGDPDLLAAGEASGAGQVLFLRNLVR